MLGDPLYMCVGLSVPFELKGLCYVFGVTLAPRNELFLAIFYA